MIKRIIGISLLILSVLATVSCSNSTKLYSLEEAYEKELITKEDLWNIAYIYNNYTNISGFEYEIKENNLELTADLEKKIKKAYLKEELSDLVFVSVNGVNIKRNYGQYSGCYVLEMDSDYVKVNLDIHDRYEIDGVVFLNYTGYYIKVFVDNEL
jgi:hypothetical protein